jgi:DNA-directed RNA polymerase specialized sigma24 family protein
MDEHTTDEELMKRFYACNVAAFAEIIRRWLKPLYSLFLACPTCRDRDRAGDLTLETLLRLYLTKDKPADKRYSPERPLRSYIFQIARNLHRDAHRSDARNREDQYLEED